MENKSKKLWILLGVIAVIVLIIIVAASQGKKSAKQSGVSEKTGQPAPAGGVAAPTAPAGTAVTAPVAEIVPTAPAGTAVTAPVAEILKDAEVIVPGANPIKDNKVVTLGGKPTLNNVAPMTLEAPQETGAIDKSQLSDKVIKIDVSAAGFNPKEFTVKAGAPTTIAVSSIDKFTHIFIFNDLSLSAIAVGVGPNETRAITFNAPAKGEYTFHCDVPGHTGRGETGKMIVK